jgi:hypothetical protein
MILLSTYFSKYLFSYVIFYMVLMCVKIILDFFKHLFIIYEKCYILGLEKKFERPKLYSLCVTFGCYRILRVNWLGELKKIGFNWICWTVLIGQIKSTKNRTRPVVQYHYWATLPILLILYSLAQKSYLI